MVAGACSLPENHSPQQDRPNIRIYQVLPDSHVASGNRQAMPTLPVFHVSCFSPTGSKS
jgi:hypothetical protein